MTNMVQNLLEEKEDVNYEYDYKLVEKILQQVFAKKENNYTHNRYQYLMHVLSYVQNDIHFMKIPSIYFDFFKENEPNQDIDTTHEDVTSYQNNLSFQLFFPESVVDKTP